LLVINRWQLQLAAFQNGTNVGVDNASA